jgi:hypothetical protein
MIKSYMKTNKDFDEKLKQFTVGARSKSIENLFARMFPQETKLASELLSPKASFFDQAVVSA